MAKEQKKIETHVEKKYYEVKVEMNAPILVVFRVLAESAEQALELSDSSPPSLITKPNLKKAKRLNAKVYDAGTSMIRHTRKY